MTTANLLLPEIAESQSGKATTHNEALHAIDALLNCGVIDRDLTAPPGSPVNGDVYIPKATATGAWAGKENQLAHYDVNAWKFYAPEEGWSCYVRDEDALLVYTGSAWTVLAGAGAGVTSVALAMPAQFSIAGSPITAAGTLTVTWTTETANTVFAGPTSGGAAVPTFRALVAADLPAVSLTAGVSGTLPVANGGTGQSTQTAAFDALDPLTTKGDVIAHNGTNSIRLPVGSNDQVLTADSTAAAGVKWGAGGAGGLSNFTEAKNTTSPNATVPVVSLTGTSSEANIDVAIKPKGDGALTRWIADGTTAGGNKRGANATDWQVTGLAAAWVASGDYSVIGGGRYNQAVGTYTVVAGGYNNLASSGNYASIGGGQANAAAGAHGVVSGGNANSAAGQYGSVGGGNTNAASAVGARVGGGQSNTASATGAAIGGGVNHAANANYTTIGGGTGNTASGAQATIGGGESNTASGISSCVPGGKEATTRGIEGLLAFGSGKIGTLGDAQYGKYVIRRATTDATPSALTTTGAAASTTNGVILPNNSSYTFKGLVSARNTANGDSSGWEFTGVIKRGANAAATALVAAVTPTLIAQDAGAATWVLAVTADTTNGGLSVTVTGVAATTIRWVATIDTVEVTN